MNNSMGNTKLNKARELLIQKYINALEQEQLPWELGLRRDLPRNAISGQEYNGMNSLLLSFVANEREYTGNRWCTFTQIADKDNKYHPDQKWHLIKGSKSVPIEYWYVYNVEEKRKYTFNDYNKIVTSDPKKESEFRLCSRVYLVFNEDCIEGIPKEIPNEKTEFNRLEVIDKIIKNMGVNYKEEGCKAYYNNPTDSVVVPPKELFKCEYEYCATQLHELCHATGHASRLNRNLENAFGSENYAKEELKAEIGSSFLMQELDLTYDDTHIQNHLAYVQSWIDVLKKDPNELFRAIKDANKIVEYIEEKGEINISKNTELVLETITVPNVDYDYDYEI